MKLSVIIPTHDPRPHYIARVLSALRDQTLPLSEWELLVIDNASEAPLSVDIAWHPEARVVSEPELGLTRARLRGFSEARTGIAVLVDDDNILDPSYLAAVVDIFQAHPFLGTCSGAITLEFEDPASRPPETYFKFLTTRRVERAVWSNDPSHNDSTPWGAGMGIRREVFEAYLAVVRGDPRRTRLDLQGKTLVYGGDTDIAFTGCAIGFGKGVFPSLHLTHLIPKRRCEIPNLLRSAEGQAYSQVLHGYLVDGHIHEPRRDFLGRVGERIRYLLSDRNDRLIISAWRRGYARASRELGRKSTQL
jgi:glycosyltransferase involved in cell wall biosynthesis